jgi:hypothetical protein
MNITKYQVTITGLSPLLLHWDNLDWADLLKQWATDPANTKDSVPGDDRTPAWRWIGNVYHDEAKELVILPSDNLMTMLREGGKLCPTGKGQKTFKAQTQSGIIIEQEGWPLLVASHAIRYAPILKLQEERSFSVHQAKASAMGFELFVKRAKIGKSKHVRVRPKFRGWTTTGELTVVDEQITESVLQKIITFAGHYAGIGDWRPSSPMSPGIHGRFTAIVKAL